VGITGHPPPSFTTPLPPHPAPPETKKEKLSMPAESSNWVSLPHGWEDRKADQVALEELGSGFMEVNQLVEEMTNLLAVIYLVGGRVQNGESSGHLPHCLFPIHPSTPPQLSLQPHCHH